MAKMLATCAWMDNPLKPRMKLIKIAFCNKESVVTCEIKFDQTVISNKPEINGSPSSFGRSKTGKIGSINADIKDVMSIRKSNLIRTEKRIINPPTITRV